MWSSWTFFLSCFLFIYSCRWRVALLESEPIWCVWDREWYKWKTLILSWLGQALWTRFVCLIDVTIIDLYTIFIKVIRINTFHIRSGQLGFACETFCQKLSFLLRIFYYTCHSLGILFTTHWGGLRQVCSSSSRKCKQNEKNKSNNKRITGKMCCRQSLLKEITLLVLLNTAAVDTGDFRLRVVSRRRVWERGPNRWI